MKEVNELQYSKDWRNPSDFATYENNEERVRADMQFLFDEIKNWANSGLLPALVELAKQVKFVNPNRVRVGDVDENGDPYFAEMEPGLVTVKSQDGDILYTLRINALGVEVENGRSWASVGMGLDSDCPEITLMNPADDPSIVQMMAGEEQASVTVRAGGNELRFYANQYGAQVAGLSEPVMNYDAATKWYVVESIRAAMSDPEVGLGKAGKGIKTVALNADYTLTITFDDDTAYTTPSIRGAQGPKGDTGAQGPKGDKGDTGPQGAQGPAGANGRDGLDATPVTPLFANSIAECTDKTKFYVLPDGFIYAYMNGGTVIQTVTEKIVGTADNPWGTGRLGSSGSVSTQAGCVVTPYIDLTKYPVPFEIHLEGITFAGQTYNTCSQYKTDKTHIVRHDANTAGFQTNWRNATFTANGDGTALVSVTAIPTNKSDVVVGYTRFTAYGTEADANVYVQYKAEVSGSMWVNTGHAFVPADYEARILSLEKEIAALAKDEGVNIATFTLANPAAKAFMATAAYDDADYSYTNVTNYAGSDYYRKDQPLPVIIGWDKNDTATQYTVSINTVSGVLNAGTQTYYAKDPRLTIWNLIPGKTYYYKVYALCADGSAVWIKDGSFTTTAGSPRMLNIDGIQNVRDIGGYTGLNSKKVKYGLVYRGSAMDEAIASTFRISDIGAQEMCQRVGIKTDVDLRYGYTESALGIDFLNTPTGYESYSAAITNATQRGNFKTLLEGIVTQLTNAKPVYIHCQGGCDRTGTLVFLLMGLLGVSESDLAKEYELSSLSAIGKKTRTRNSTTYDYKGMVAAIKAYSGSTLADKFVAFATACGVESATITSFRNLMLE